MKIAIVAEQANSSRLTGVEHYCRELILALSRIDGANEYILYLRTAPGGWCGNLPRNFTVKVLPAAIAWTQLRLSWEMLRAPPDALLVPSFSLPLIHPANTVVTIHDLAWRRFPETEDKLQLLSLRFTHKFASMFARKLIAVSNSTKTDMVALMGVAEHRIKVIYHGFDLGGASAEKSLIAAARSESSAPFILCLGTLQPRKNLLRLIDAFEAFKRKTGLPHTLVLAGRKGWKCEDILRRVDQSRDVQYLGYVDDRLELLRGAALLVQPALYEGFGLSILDAFAEGVPVACSDRSSLPEVAGDAAELFDPGDTASIMDAMVTVMTDPVRANDLRRKGSDRLSNFSWLKCAQHTLDLLGAAS